jgi:hypothetical protein
VQNLQNTCTEGTYHNFLKSTKYLYDILVVCMYDDKVWKLHVFTCMAPDYVNYMLLTAINFTFLKISVSNKQPSKMMHIKTQTSMRLKAYQTCTHNHWSYATVQNF